MTAADQEDRSSMEELSQYIEQKESTEEVVCNLVSLVLGDPQVSLVNSPVITKNMASMQVTFCSGISTAYRTG